MIQSLDNGHMTERETRAIVRKAGKRIGQLTAQNAVSESKIHSLESQIEELRGPKTRKRVAVDPNTRFANIDAIKKAMDEAAAVIATTEARLVNTLTSTSLTSRSRIISALGRYNQKCDVVENVYV